MASASYKKNNFRQKAALKTAAFIKRLCIYFGGGGTSLPGLIAMKLDPNLFAELSENIPVILITGTNGKTTSVHMAAHMLNSLHIPCVYSSHGENLDSSILSVLIDWYNSKRIKPEIAVLECDEKYVKLLLKKLHPISIVITNLAADQVDRFGTPENVAHMLSETFKDYQGKICIDSSDCIVLKAISNTKSDQVIRFHAYEDKVTIQGTHYDLKLDIPCRYNLRNAAAAMAALYSADISVNDGLKALATVPPIFGRMESIRIENTDVILDLIKNPSSAEEAFQYISGENKNLRIVIGFNNLSEDGTDTTWMGEIPWKKYQKCLSDVIVYSDSSDEVAMYLKQAGLYPIVINSPSQLINTIRKSNRQFYMMMNYSCMMKFRKKLARLNYVQDFWKRGF